MPFLNHAPYQVRIFLQIVPHQKKCCRYLLILQNVQNLFGTAVFITGIEGQIQHFFSGVSQIGRMVGFQLVPGCIADGRCALLPEGKPPASGFHAVGHKDTQRNARRHNEGQQ